MRIDTRCHHDVLIIEPRERITVETEAQFTKMVRSLLDAGPRRFALDLAEVPYIDSVGLGAIVQAYTSARRRGGDLKLLRANSRVRRLLTITRLSTVLENCDTEDEVERSFDSDGEASTSSAIRHGPARLQV
jgi:anti-sigma B factor antagonist